MNESQRTAPSSVLRKLALLALAVVGLTLLLGAGTAAASKQLIGYFGAESGSGAAGGEFSDPRKVAVNNSGAGTAEKGEIYVADSSNNRIQRFGHDDSGTPLDQSDDTYPFISAWGAGAEGGGSDYEICVIAAACKAAAGTGGNGTAGGNGVLSTPLAVAVDQDTGNVYVVDGDNFRINVYDGSGVFQRSFGWDVIESGPGESGPGYEVCVATNGDVCKAGASGPGTGQIAGYPSLGGIAVSQPDGNPATGTVFVADAGNHRVDTFSLDGSSPSDFGSSTFFGDLGWPQPTTVAVDSRGIVYAPNLINVSNATFDDSVIERYDSENATGGGVGFLDPISSGVNEEQRITISATAGQFRLTFGGDTTTDIPFNATNEVVEAALEGLPSIGSGNIRVFGNNGSSSYKVGFQASLGVTDVEPIAVSSGTTPLSGGSGATVQTIDQGEEGLYPTIGTGQGTRDLSVDPDTDGPGPDADVLFAMREDGIVQQFGPLNPPGLVAPPATGDDIHGSAAKFNPASGLSFDEGNGTLYVAAYRGGGGNGQGIYVLGDGVTGPPTASLDSILDVTPTSGVAHFTINPNGAPITRYHLEYSLDGSKWLATPDIVLGTQTTPQELSLTINPLVGLSPSTLYHVRLVVAKKFQPTVTTPELTFTTLSAPPIVETVGTPVRTTETAQLGGRVDPRGASTAYFFEYGDQGPCGSNPCAQTEAKPAGSENLIKLVSQEVAELRPDTTYHYRVVADNGNSGSPVFGEDRTVTTRPIEASLSHGHFPGPPGSDRAWELVSAPEAGGNSTDEPFAISDDGSHAVYGIAGGAPFSDTGGFNQFYAERTASGWKTRKIFPSRDELSGPNWQGPSGPSDLLSFVGLNTNAVGNSFALYRMSADGPSEKLYEVASESQYGFFFAMSDDGSRALIATKESPDPAHPSPPGTNNVYDITTGSPHLVNLLPGDVVPSCGIAQGETPGPYVLPGGSVRAIHRLSPNGDLFFFGDGCTKQLYVRDLVAAETRRVSPAPASGPACGAGFIKSTPDAAFFWSKSRLVSDDTAPASCEAEADGDVYSYDLDDGSLKCVTCVVPGQDANVLVGNSYVAEKIAVTEDGSRVYFRAGPLLPGAPSEGIYRVHVAGGDLAYIGAIKDFTAEATGIDGSAMTPDGSVLLFGSSDPGLNPLGGGAGNAGTKQLYRYDDRDRSLVCISCPSDGTAPKGNASSPGGGSVSANAARISRDGSIVAFNTPTPLVGADQNTAGVGQSVFAGTDAYEWRDGKHLLLSDGLTNWAGENSTPRVKAMSPSGNDILFTAATQYTADAVDDFRRLYDARVGGGFDFPTPPPPCPLEVCQGTPKGAPEEAAPGTRAFSGPGNAAPQRKKQRARKKKQRAKHKKQSAKKHAKRHAKRRADHDRRASR